MKITVALVDKLIRLRDGESVPASALSGSWVEELLTDGALISRSNGRGRVLSASSSSAFVRALAAIDERLSDLDGFRSVLVGESLRSEQACMTGNSKLRVIRSCPGFLVNSYDRIVCSLGDNEFVVSPLEGSFVFVSDWEAFSVPSDVIVVGIENMENFRLIRQQRKFFENEIGADAPLLFVSRYPQSTDLREWLLRVPNRYVHFGDFDLAGISIFLTEFHKYLGSRARFLVPSDISIRLADGSAERYRNQYARLKNLSTDLPYLQDLIRLIHSYHRGYDQEGYIMRIASYS